MPTITLEDGTEVEISKKSHDAFKDAVKGQKWKPQMGNTYYTVNSILKVDAHEWCNSSTGQNRYLAGNIFKAKEEAEMCVLRFRSLLAGTYTGEGDFVVWEFEAGEPWPVGAGHKALLMCDPKFNTKAECEAWYKKYGKAWEYLLN